MHLPELKRDDSLLKLLSEVFSHQRVIFEGRSWMDPVPYGNRSKLYSTHCIKTIIKSVRET